MGEAVGSAVGFHAQVATSVSTLHPPVRNLFDPYSQAENRLTHALAVCLNEDRRLLGRFLRRVGVSSTVAPGALRIVVQRLPGDPPEADDEAGGMGLPDIVIHDDESWCLVVESKVMSALRWDQLDRHRRTLKRRGFERGRMLVLARDRVNVPPAFASSPGRISMSGSASPGSGASGAIACATTFAPRSDA